MFTVVKYVHTMPANAVKLMHPHQRGKSKDLPTEMHHVTVSYKENIHCLGSSQVVREEVPHVRGG